MSDLEVVIDNRQPKEEVKGRSCSNCGNYQTCTIRFTMPQKVFELDTHKPYTLPEGFSSPMPCGGQLWREVESSDVLLIEKQPDETWKQFYARRDAAKLNPQLTELP